MGQLTLSNVRKSFGNIEVLKGIDLAVADREFVVFVGPSGCGKSTLLRMIAGLEATSAGDIVIDSKRVNDLPPVKRGIAMVFQSYALYPHMTVFENIAFPLRVLRMDESELNTKVHLAARTLQLEERLQQKPGTLSGGQRQRVAIGRAIVREPKIFLFDEPLSNLDAALRSEMRIELSSLHKKLNATMIYVTHDQVEAMTMADKIVVLNEGMIAQIGSPLELYHKPENLFVAGFIGNPKMNFLPARCVGVSERSVTVTIDNLAGEIQVPVKAPAETNGQSLLLGIRPEHVTVGGGDVALTLAPNVVEHLGIHTVAYSSIAKTPFCAILPGSIAASEEQPLEIGINGADCHLFSAKGTAFPRNVQLTAISPDVLKASQRR